MLVKVRFSDDSCGTVDNSILDGLVRSKQIQQIRRASGWVAVDSGQARQERGERRHSPTRRGSSSLIDIYV